MAEINLTNQGIEYYLPRFTYGKRDGKVIFPEYIFFKTKITDTFQSIGFTKGVSDFIRFNRTFAKTRDEKIDMLRDQQQVKIKLDAIS